MTKNLTPRISVTDERIFIKLEIKNDNLKTTHDAKIYLDPTSWVVWANTQFATVRILCFFFSFSFS